MIGWLLVYKTFKNNYIKELISLIDNNLNKEILYTKVSYNKYL